ncbi:hypothetical protein PpBr36_02213 [Pyricularia pennisetigena]|uniref:hypothetical protein n=1 Tax=Pyricularia pennisetigena TaxID=1578925 RepID=UPI00114DE5DD|nr:hypothetical protein PpBr36_02213 [Pyricularia pennisetigena]TLS30802.1 hypothetical protein PpBr36_02213 [Pyricularia pennisetigena]
MLAQDEQQVLAAGTTDASACQISNMTAYEMEKGRKIVGLTKGAIESFVVPRLNPINSTGGEQWAFDGVSEDGVQSFMFGFYRDPNYSILGAGNFRLSLEFGFANRERVAELYYAERTVIETCPQGVRGVWYSESEGWHHSFLIKADMSEAVIILNSDSLKGTITYKSKALPIAADGHVWPNGNATTEPIRYLHWSEPIPAGTVDFDVEIKGKKVAWKGIGGHERFWTAFSWFTCMTNLQGLRAMPGPYVLSYFRFESGIDKGHVHQSAVLFKDGVQIFRSTLGAESDTEDYVLAQKTYGGAVTGDLKDKVTGFQVELVSPSKKRHYTFFIEHKNLAFEYLLGEGVGGSGFSAIAKGGHVGQPQYEGPSLTEALTFPKNSPLFKNNYV